MSGLVPFGNIDRDPRIQQAINEIFATYGDRVTVGAKAKSLLKFGQNTVVGTSEATIMELAGSETEEAYVSTNAIDSIISTDASFTGTVRIEGHTISSGLLTFVAQTKAANGQTRVALDTPLARATRIECWDETAFSTPATDKVYVFENGAATSGVPDDATTVHLMLSAAERQSLKAATAISNNDYAIVTRIYADINKKTAATADIRFRTRVINSGDIGFGGFKTKLIRSINSAGKGSFDFLPEPFFVIPKNTDIIMTGTASTTGVSLSAGFDAYLAKVIN